MPVRWDIDTGIEPLYGRQQGAEPGYSPAKPAPPSHALHAFWVGNPRLVLDVQVGSGKQHTSVHAKAAHPQRQANDAVSDAAAWQGQAALSR